MKALATAVEALESRIAPAQLIVTNLKDSGAGSLRQAILDANATIGVADMILFQTSNGHPLQGTITLATDLPGITDPLTISGPVFGKSNGIVINGAHHQILNITSADVSISDLTVKNGRAFQGGGVYVNVSGQVTLTDVAISHNQAVSAGSGQVAYGGGIYVAGGTVTLADSKVSGNTAKGINGSASGSAGDGYGGGIFTMGNLTITNSVISGNLARGGNGASGGHDGGDGYGGGIYSSSDSGVLTIQNSKISGNKAFGGNGGAGGGDGGDCGGAAVYNHRATVTISNTTISGNKAKGGTGAAGDGGGDGGSTWGAGLSNYAGNASMTIQDSVVTGNIATLAAKGGSKASVGMTYGGGIYSSQYSGGVQLNLVNVTVSKNSAAYGGGLYIGGGTLDMSSTTISKNTGSKGGGGLYLRDSTVSIVNSTVGKNHSGDDGGGIFVDSGTVDIHNSTLASNSATNHGGGLMISGGSVTVISTIIANNSAHASADVEGSLAASFSLIEKVTSAVTFTLDVSNITGVDPLLGSLADNGGPTKTFLPSANSPVIDQGSNPDSQLTDQRGAGFARTFGLGTDIGAVEVQ